MAGTASRDRVAALASIRTVSDYFRASVSSPLAVFVWIKLFVLLALSALGVVMVFDSTDPRSLAIGTVFVVVGGVGASSVWLLHWMLICHERELRALREIVRLLRQEGRTEDD